MFHRIGLRKDVDVSKIAEVSEDAEKFFDRTLPGIIYKTGEIKH